MREEILRRLTHKQKWPDKLGQNPTGHELAEAWGLKGKEIPLEDIVLEWAYTFSQYEIMSEINGESFDSTELDHYIMLHVYEFHGDRRSDFIGHIEEKYGVNTYRLQDLNMTLGDIEQAAIHCSKSQCRIFYLPDAEMSKVAKQLRELKIGGFRGNLVYLEPNKNIPDALFRKLENCEVSIREEAQNERSHT